MRGARVESQIASRAAFAMYGRGYFQRRIHFARMREALSDDERRDEAGDDVPDGLGGFAAVVRIRFGDRLAPALVPCALELALDADQHEGAIVRTPEARFEEMHQRQAAEEQLDLLVSRYN